MMEGYTLPPLMERAIGREHVTHVAAFVVDTERTDIFYNRILGAAEA